MMCYLWDRPIGPVYECDSCGLTGTIPELELANLRHQICFFHDL